ncbi:MAG: Na-Ca exchanger/integrin-beta4, partial [Acidimicrobiaceae bacterium]
SSPTNALLGAVSNAVVTIVENDVEFLFGTPLVSALESAASATVTVWRRGGSSVTNTVQFAVTTNSTATAASDFTSTNGTLTFKPGVTNLSFLVPLLNDTNIEGSETVELALSSPSSGTALASSNTTAVVTLQDNDSQFNFLVVTNSVAENAGTLTLNVRRTGGTVGAAGVSYATSTNGTATSGTDFTAASGTLSFKAGETNKTVVLKVTNDSALEGDEGLSVTLSAPTGEGQLGTNGVAQVTIAEDDLYSFTLTTNAVSVAENGTNVVLSVRRSGATNATTVKYLATGVTAKAGTDFVASTGTLSFADGETNQTVTVTITDDTLIEANETLTFALNTPGTNGVLGAISAATVTITENDAALALSAATYTVLESATNVVLTLTRTGTTNGTVSVNYATTNLTATAGTDYTNTSGTVSFAAGVTNGTITVPVINDSAIETAETFKVVLS